ncbi:hypothetical protein WUBG_00650 [Wuchereria bancrofti]|uniref:Uncharacterized protein n=1 Tax=Wuchereria bancrofti TaxID=6293 RepID=J9FFL6_WUCBA|nr:hypothetical protein WUBG_00650 [Wuchereria bancrofti]
MAISHWTDDRHPIRAIHQQFIYHFPTTHCRTSPPFPSTSFYNHTYTHAHTRTHTHTHTHINTHT